MARLRWRSIFAGLSLLLIVGGVNFYWYLSWKGPTRYIETLSVPVPLKPGKYISPFFTTNLDDDYLIEIYYLPPHRMPLDIDWKVVDEGGTLIKSGAYREDGRMGANEAILEEHYRSRRLARQRVILNVQRDVQQVLDSDTRLHIGVPRGVSQDYSSPAAVRWLVVLAGPGAGIFVVLAILRVRHRAFRSLMGLRKLIDSFFPRMLSQDRKGLQRRS